MAKDKVTQQLFKSLGEACNNKMDYPTIGLNPKLYKEIVLENSTPDGLLSSIAHTGPTVLATPFGNFKLIIAMIPKDCVLFVDSNGTPQGMIQLGGTPNIYRRIILD